MGADLCARGIRIAYVSVAVPPYITTRKLKRIRTYDRASQSVRVGPIDRVVSDICIQVLIIATANRVGLEESSQPR